MSETLRNKMARSLWSSYCSSCGVEDNWSEQDEETKEEYRVWADSLIEMVRKDGESRLL